MKDTKSTIRTTFGNLWQHPCNTPGRRIIRPQAEDLSWAIRAPLDDHRDAMATQIKSNTKY
jgi:hypothetical protein